MVAALAYKQMRDAIAPKPRGFSAIGVFLFFGAVMATFAATTLLRRGTPLDRLWALNPTAYTSSRLWAVLLRLPSWHSPRLSSRQESGGSAAAFGDGD
jgi:hypothetical protein